MRRNRKKRYIDTHEESWAVSYADLLMVLMSFFIVFFNLDGQSSTKGELLDIISKPFRNGTKSKVVEKPRPEMIKRSIASQKKRNSTLDDLGDHLIGLNLANLQIRSNGKNPRGLLLELPDDIFSVGSYQVNGELSKYIDDILKSINRYKDQLRIVAIGHADKIPVKGTREVIDSNFVLSSLRASKAVEYITSKGFDPDSVSGQAVNVEKRATRSLTLKIYER